jgi:hypothetical protein
MQIKRYSLISTVLGIFFTLLAPTTALAQAESPHLVYGQSYYQPYYQSYYQANYASGATWVLGARLAGTYSQYFSGRVDDIRVYNRTLSAAEVANIYNNSAPSSGLVGWWPLQGFLTSVAEGFLGWVQFAGSVVPPCADSVENICVDPDTTQRLDPWCQPIPTFCTFGCVDDTGLCRQPEGCLSTRALACESTGLVRHGAQATLYWDVQYATVCTVSGTNGDYWESLAEPAGVQTSPITQRTTFTLSCDDGALVDQVTVSLVPSYQEI